MRRTNAANSTYYRLTGAIKYQMKFLEETAGKTSIYNLTYDEINNSYYSGDYEYLRAPKESIPTNSPCKEWMYYEYESGKYRVYPAGRDASNNWKLYIGCYPEEEYIDIDEVEVIDNNINPVVATEADPKEFKIVSNHKPSYAKIAKSAINPEINIISKPAPVQKTIKSAPTQSLELLINSSSDSHFLNLVKTITDKHNAITKDEDALNQKLKQISDAKNKESIVLKELQQIRDLIATESEVLDSLKLIRTSKDKIKSALEILEPGAICYPILAANSVPNLPTAWGDIESE